MNCSALLLTLFLVSIIPVHASYIPNRRAAYGICAQSMPCRWAKCSWEPDLTRPSPCELTENDCECPMGTECKATNIRQPSSTFFFTQYRCLSRLLRP